MMHVLFLAGIALSLLGLGAIARAEGTPRYAEAMEQELTKLGLQPQCTRESATRERCSFAVRSSMTERSLQAHAVYDDASDTIYVYVEQLVSLPPSSRHRERVLQRLMELNWELLIGKFEWNAKTGEVRLSAVVSTDSNFDRRAFRSTVRALDVLGARYLTEIASLL